jgi:hypothetical protein
VLFTGGGEPVPVFKLYTEAPATGTRRGLLQLSDSRVELESSADLLSEHELTKNKIQYKTSITIFDKVYEIEELQLGQVVGFRNFGNYVDALIMQIVGLSYEPDRVTLQLDSLRPTVSKRLADLKRNLNAQETIDAPTIPTT